MPKDNLDPKKVKCHKCSQDTSYKATMVHVGKHYCFDCVGEVVQEQNESPSTGTCVVKEGNKWE